MTSKCLRKFIIITSGTVGDSYGRTLRWTAFEVGEAVAASPSHVIRNPSISRASHIHRQIWRRTANRSTDPAPRIVAITHGAGTSACSIATSACHVATSACHVATCKASISTSHVASSGAGTSTCHVATSAICVASISTSHVAACSAGSSTCHVTISACHVVICEVANV